MITATGTLLADRARRSIFLTLIISTPVFNLSFLLNAAQIYKIDTQAQRAEVGCPLSAPSGAGGQLHLTTFVTCGSPAQSFKDFYVFTHYTVYFLLHLNLFSYTENLGSEPYLLIAYLYYSGCQVFQVVPILLLTEYWVELKIS